jgi:hypothetical protein
MKFLKQPRIKRARRIVVLGIFLVPALYLLPMPTKS